jgi:hypothetical protein
MGLITLRTHTMVLVSRRKIALFKHFSLIYAMDKKILDKLNPLTYKEVSFWIQYTKKHSLIPFHSPAGRTKA